MSAGIFFWLLGNAGLGLVALFLSVRATRPFEVRTISARVRYVIDGDTFLLHGDHPRIRIFGINAPEMKSRGGQQHARISPGSYKARPFNAKSSPATIVAALLPVVG